MGGGVGRHAQIVRADPRRPRRGGFDRELGSRSSAPRAATSSPAICATRAPGRLGACVCSPWPMSWTTRSSGRAPGKRRYGLTDYGRDVIAECQRLGVARRPRAHVGRRASAMRCRCSNLRSCSATPASGSSPAEEPLAQLLARNAQPLGRAGTRRCAAGGVIGLTLSTLLLGAERLTRSVARSSRPGGLWTRTP